MCVMLVNSIVNERITAYPIQIQCAKDGRTIFHLEAWGARGVLVVPF